MHLQTCFPSQLFHIIKLHHLPQNFSKTITKKSHRNALTLALTFSPLKIMPVGRWSVPFGAKAYFQRSFAISFRECIQFYQHNMIIQLGRYNSIYPTQNIIQPYTIKTPFPIIPSHRAHPKRLPRQANFSRRLGPIARGIDAIDLFLDFSNGWWRVKGIFQGYVEGILESSKMDGVIWQGTK